MNRTKSNGRQDEMNKNKNKEKQKNGYKDALETAGTEEVEGKLETAREKLE